MSMTLDDMAARLGRFEEGVPADPTVNMSEEDKKKWEAMNEEHRDKFKTATGLRVRFHEAALPGDIVPPSEAESDTEAKFEEGKPADPTENMTEEQRKEWWKQHGEHKDEFKEAAWPGLPPRLMALYNKLRKWGEANIERYVRHGGIDEDGLAEALARQAGHPEWAQDSDHWVYELAYDLRDRLMPAMAHTASETDTEAKFEEGKPADPTENMSEEDKKKWMEYHGQVDKLAASGLYGFTKSVQADCEGAFRKIQRQAKKIMKGASSRDGKVAEFLATHARRADSLPARLLVAAFNDLSPKVELEEIPKEAGASVRGLYGFPTKTARLGLNACSELRAFTGEAVEDLHVRRADRHQHITGFLQEHIKAASDDYAKMILACYPENVSKAAADLPKTVEGWLAWED